MWEHTNTCSLLLFYFFSCVASWVYSVRTPSNVWIFVHLCSMKYFAMHIYISQYNYSRCYRHAIDLNAWRYRLYSPANTLECYLSHFTLNIPSSWYLAKAIYNKLSLARSLIYLYIPCITYLFIMCFVVCVCVCARVSLSSYCDDSYVLSFTMLVLSI